MPHFKPFFYIDNELNGDWKRIFVEPNPDTGGVHIEIMGNRMEAVSLFMPATKFSVFADKCIEASLAIDPDEQDWVGEAI